MTQTAPAYSDALSGQKSMARHSRRGLALVAAGALFIFAWGGLAQLSSAVVAPGRITLESSTKKIQHEEGGIVSEIDVADGAMVRAGQILMRIDDTQAAATSTSARAQLVAVQARKARLEAERDGRASIAEPPQAARDPSFAEALANETRLLAERRRGLDQKLGELSAQIDEAAAQISGLKAQAASDDSQLQLLQQQRDNVKSLYDHGYASLSRVNELQLSIERVNGDRAQALSNIARVEKEIAALRHQMAQARADRMAETLNDLKDADSRLAALTQQDVQARDVLQRVVLTAPVDGRVQELAAHTIGGVVRPGETVMVIVPARDALVVEARVDPRQIDGVHAGSPAFVRFTAFDVRSTPEGRGVVEWVSGDIETDEKTGSSFYRARLRIDQVKAPAAVRSRLVAGMPVEVQIQTGRRSALSYFLKPLIDQMHLAFKER